MKTHPSFEASPRFGECLRLPRTGEEVIMARRDEPVARAIPEGRDALAERVAVRLGVIAL